MIPPQIATFFAKPLIKYGVPAATVALLMLAVWVQGLRMHSWKVQAGAYKQTIAQMKDASDANHNRSRCCGGRYCWRCRCEGSGCCEGCGYAGR